MASFDPNRSTAQAMTRPAGAVSNASACSSISARIRSTSVSVSTMLTLTSLCPRPTACPRLSALAVQPPVGGRLFPEYPALVGVS